MCHLRGLCHRLDLYQNQYDRLDLFHLRDQYLRDQYNRQDLYHRLDQYLLGQYHREPPNTLLTILRRTILQQPTHR